MEMPERIWHLVARVLNSEASFEEEEELLELLQNNPHLQQQYELLKRVWTEKAGENKDEEQAKQYILKIINKAEIKKDNVVWQTTRRRRRRRIIAISSFVIIIITAGIWWNMSGSRPGGAVTLSYTQDNVKPQPGEAALAAPNGSRISSLLPDGSTVWLNAGSRLFYENDFTGNTREVRLEGEGFFDIVKKPGQPFIVHASGMDIRVLGTAFNVKAYPDDAIMETTLYRGSVQVSVKENNNGPIELKPNEKLVVQRSDQSIIVEEDDKPVLKKVPEVVLIHIDSTKKENERFETAWRYSRLEFRGDNFTELARKMERWYNVTIVFKGEDVKELNFNGSFEKETIEEALAALQTANVFHYEINKNEISISSPE
jgi:transmembrane sensor